MRSGRFGDIYIRGTWVYSESCDIKAHLLTIDIEMSEILNLYTFEKFQNYLLKLYTILSNI